MGDIMTEVRGILDEHDHHGHRAIEQEQSDLDLVFESAQHPDLLEEDSASRAKMAEPGPNDTETIRTLRKIVKDHQFEKIDGMVVDAFSASMALQIFDNLNQANQKKMAAMPIRKMMDVVQRIVARRG